MTADDPNSALDRAMAAGFGAETSEPASGSVDSVLRRLAHDHATPSVLTLRELPRTDAPTPDVQPVLRGSIPSLQGKYSVEGEIARGGVGVVLKACDHDLGRDVALKFLREEYTQNPGLIGRFVEEAQIGGQLQHPGIVPVYDIGLDGGRPFFTMKLIRGRTLATWLNERSGAQPDRKLLQVFEQICQTVAYAHARGVIHRDLKPANVMVGAFGEVQVVDWGMAKVLGDARAGGPETPEDAAAGAAALDSDPAGQESPAVETMRSKRTGEDPASAAGTVLGTPAYMPPEQAIGDFERMDERSDVFALGGILCHLLTGEPPYTGEDTRVLMMAADGELGPVHARLRRSGADSELIDLAIECTRSEPADRPRDAGVLAERMSAYLSSVQQRAQEALVEAAEERVRTVAARRAQRLTLGLAASALLTLMVGGGAYLWIRGEEDSRRAEVGRRVASATAEISRLHGQAQKAPLGALDSWEQARVASAQARLLAQGFPSLEAQVRQLGDAVDSGYASARTRAAEHAKDEAMRAVLVEIPFPTIDEGRSESEAHGARFRVGVYRKAYADHGLDLRAGVSTVAAAIRASRIAEELIVGLDFLASALETAGEPDEAARMWRVALAADDDPWRDRFRQILLARGAVLEELEGLAADVDPHSMPLASLVLLGHYLKEKGNPELCVSILTEAWHVHPTSTGLVLLLGVTHWGLRQYAEARGCFRAVVAQRPETWSGRRLLGKCASLMGDHAAAIVAYRHANRMKPTERGWRMLGRELTITGDIDGARHAYTEALRFNPDSGDNHFNMGLVSGLEGKFGKAIRHYREAVRLDPDREDAWANLCGLLKRNGDLDEAIAVGREAVRLRPDRVTVLINLGSALRARGEMDEAMANMRQALGYNPEQTTARINVANLHFEKGELDEADGACRKCLDSDERSVEAWVLLGKIARERGDYRESLRRFRRAHEIATKWANEGRTPAETTLVHGREAKALASREPRLASILAGDIAAANAKESVDAANLARRRRQFLRAEELYRAALDAAPDLAKDLAVRHEFHAALAAAQAACGLDVGKPTLGPEERAALHHRAVGWLRSYSRAWDNHEPWLVVLAMSELGWLTPLACVRDKDALERLPAAERAGWQAFWKDVGAKRERANARRK